MTQQIVAKKWTYCPIFDKECVRYECTSFMGGKQMSYRERRDAGIRGELLPHPMPVDWCVRFNKQIVKTIYIEDVK